jgi:hypothetical protein
MKSSFSNVGFWIFVTATFFSILAFVITDMLFPQKQLQIIRLTQIYALTGLTFLYSAILVEPFCHIFKDFRFNRQYIQSRRALVVATFYFGLLHTCLAFFGQLGGFEGLGFLSLSYNLRSGCFKVQVFENENPSAIGLRLRNFNFNSCSYAWNSF